MRFGRSFQIRGHKLFVKRKSFARETSEKYLKGKLYFFGCLVCFAGKKILRQRLLAECGPLFFCGAVDAGDTQPGLSHEDSHLAAMMRLVGDQIKQGHPTRSRFAIHVVLDEQRLGGPVFSDFFAD